MAELAGSATASEADRLLQAEALVRAYCGWHIAPSREDSLTVVGSRDRVIVLPTLRLTGVASITVDGVPVDEECYAWTSSGLVSRYDVWQEAWWYSRRGPQVVVEFTHGFTDVPADVTAVVQAVATRAVENPSSLVRETVGPFTNQYASGSSALSLLAPEMKVLDHYRLPQRA